jgi:hypothetical protein
VLTRPCFASGAGVGTVAAGGRDRGNAFGHGSL